MKVYSSTRVYNKFFSFWRNFSTDAWVNFKTFGLTLGVFAFFMAQSLVADGRIQTEPLHTSTVSLEGMSEAFAGLARNPQEVKILVDPRL